MLVIPARHQIRPSVEPAARMLMDVGLEGLVFRQNRSIIWHLQRDRVPYIDLWPALVARDSVTPVSFAEDSHLTALGHQVVGQQILGRLHAMLPALLKQSHKTPRTGMLGPGIAGQRKVRPGRRLPILRGVVPVVGRTNG
jgi:hypothetical protein